MGIFLSFENASKFIFDSIQFCTRLKCHQCITTRSIFSQVLPLLALCDVCSGRLARRVLMIMLGNDGLGMNPLDQGDNGQNYITVIPVEYPPRSYHHDFPPGHVARSVNSGDCEPWTTGLSMAMNCEDKSFPVQTYCDSHELHFLAQLCSLFLIQIQSIQMVVLWSTS